MLRKKRKFENRKGTEKQNYSTTKLTVEIKESHFLAVKLFAEHTEYSLASIIETAIEKFFPNIDFENLSEIDDDD